MANDKCYRLVGARAGMICGAECWKWCLVIYNGDGLIEQAYEFPAGFVPAIKQGATLVAECFEISAETMLAAARAAGIGELLDARSERGRHSLTGESEAEGGWNIPINAGAVDCETIASARLKLTPPGAIPPSEMRMLSLRVADAVKGRGD